MDPDPDPGGPKTGGSGKNLFRIPDPGSERHRIPDPQHCFMGSWFWKSAPPYLLVTCRDVSSPPCRSVADASRHQCGWPSSCCNNSVSPCSFAPVLLFTFIFHFISLTLVLFSYYVVLTIFTMHHHQQFSFQSHFHSSLIVFVLCYADIFHHASPPTVLVSISFLILAWRKMEQPYVCSPCPV